MAVKASNIIFMAGERKLTSKPLPHIEMWILEKGSKTDMGGTWDEKSRPRLFAHNYNISEEKAI